jgi:2-(1,2-epoxy-1,2-dihydrophenyl)acetyl-CoA isomerase
MARTEALAADLAEAPTFALGLAKKLFNAAVGPSLESYLDVESLVQPQLHMTVDNAEGVAAFREKRHPNSSAADGFTRRGSRPPSPPGSISVSRLE